MSVLIKFLSFFVFTLFIPQYCFSLKASDYFEICKRDDPDLNNCIKNTIQKLPPLLKKGSKDLRLSSVEPMIVPKVQVQQGSGPVSIDSTFHDLHVNGITNYNIKSVSADLDKGVIKINVDLPYLYMTGDYEIKGRILILPVTGKGDSWSNYTGVQGLMTLNLSKFDKNGESYLKLEDLKFSISVDKATIHMNNLFNGNKELGDTMNKFMSTNWQVVFQELKPVVDIAIGSLLKNVAEKIFQMFSYNELFPKG